MTGGGEEEVVIGTGGMLGEGMTGEVEEEEAEVVVIGIGEEGEVTGGRGGRENERGAGPDPGVAEGGEVPPTGACHGEETDPSLGPGPRMCGGGVCGCNDGIIMLLVAS